VAIKTIKIKGQLIKKNSIIFPVPKSHTQMGSLSAKNATEKFSRLGTLRQSCRVNCEYQGGFRPRILPLYCGVETLSVCANFSQKNKFFKNVPLTLLYMFTVYCICSIPLTAQPAVNNLYDELKGIYIGKASFTQNFLHQMMRNER
jgi:hypothetical protein